MDSTILNQSLHEPSANIVNLDRKKRIPYIQKCASYIIDDEVSYLLSKLSTSIKKLPRNEMDLCQPADSFDLEKIEDVFRK